LQPLELDWFNADYHPELQLLVEGPQLPLQNLPTNDLWHLDSRLNQSISGLEAKLYEGSWESVPDFNWLAPIKSEIVPGFEMMPYPQTDRIGICYRGFFAAPRDGEYTFHLASANGAMWFVGKAGPAIQRCGQEAPPTAAPAVCGQMMKRPGGGLWASVEGRVTFISKTGRGLELDLNCGTGIVQVRVADANGLEAAGLFDARIRVRGVGKSISSLDNTPILGRLVATGAGDLEILEPAPSLEAPPNLITSAEQVQLLRPETAARHLPVRIRGVVTSAFGSFTLQDDTRGVYVDQRGLTNRISPLSGEMWEVTGYTKPGEFTPVIVPEKGEYLGAGRPLAPVHPTWRQLCNGSMDIQWVEIQGVVTSVSSNQISLLMPEGSLHVWFEAQNQNILKPTLNCYVTIRGVLFASWDVTTHEVNPREVFLRNTSININRPAPADVFAAPLKRTRDLLHFDLEAAFYQRIRLRGIVIYAGSRMLFLNDDNVGVRIVPVQTVSLHPGDLVEAAGYPEIGGASPILREAVVRKLGVQPAPAARILDPEDLARSGLDATRVQIQALLLNQRLEPGDVVLEMAAGLRPFVARFHGNKALLPALRSGSLLQLTGAYASLRPQVEPQPGLDPFELLLASPGDITVLKQPPWWTLRRLLVAVGALSLLLSLVALWVSQLRRQVNRQTRIIREKAEREATLEERNRIARELHDTLEQSLAGVSLQLRALSDALPHQPEKSGDILKVTRQMVRHGQDEARRTVRNLRTLALEQGGLPGALAGLAQETSDQFPVKIEFGVVGTPRPLAGKIENHLLRVGQEAVTNALKHGQASAIQIHLHFEPAAVRLEVRDDGRGFDVAHAAPSSAGHFGLLGMRERAEKIHGTLNISSTPAGGTTVVVVVPLPPAAADAKPSHEEEN